MNRYLLLACTLSVLAACDRNGDTPEKTFDLHLHHVLPAPLIEASGLEAGTDGASFWAINDGGPARLYQFSSAAAVSRTVDLQPASNVDWEDLARDEAGNLYVGDFGNNANDRQDLRIYRVPAPEPLSTTQLVPEVIAFTFADQSAFPPPPAQLHFDVEAMFVRNGSIYLCTRDRSEPFGGRTRLYRLPATPALHQATLLGTFTTDSDSGKGAITGADISPDGSRVALISNEMLFIFTNFSGDIFFDGSVKRYELPVKRQFEGVVFADNTTLWLCNEASGTEEGGLWKATLPE